ncbi:MAG: arsenate reductase [Neisseriaceae bacterium]|nr:MAG: arsenate reductase [Neisseriaceae bacterium]
MNKKVNIMSYLYHNPKCSKSRAAVQFLTEENIEFETILYLETGLSESEIRNLLKYLNLEPVDIIRTGEGIWKTEYQGKVLSNTAVIEALIRRPELLERPIYVKNEQAVIARPLEKLQEFIESSH